VRITSYGNQTISSTRPSCSIQVGVINSCHHQKFMTLTGELSWQRPTRSAVPEIYGGAHQNLNGSRDLTIPLSGMVCHTWIALATVNVPTKFDTPLTTKILKPIQNVNNGVVWGSSLKVTGNSSNRWSTYEFLLAFHSNYVPILHRFWDIGRKSPFKPTPDGHPRHPRTDTHDDSIYRASIALHGKNE